MIRVLVADDEPLIRAGIRMILNSAGDIEEHPRSRGGPLPRRPPPNSSTAPLAKHSPEAPSVKVQ